MPENQPAEERDAEIDEADLIELPPDDVGPPADLHGPGGPEDYLPREADPPIPPPEAGMEAFGDILTPGVGYVNAPDFVRDDDDDDAAHGHVHGPGCAHHHHAPARPIERGAPKVGRNDPCPCGSGKKFKKCCGAS